MIRGPTEDAEDTMMPRRLVVHATAAILLLLMPPAGAWAAPPQPLAADVELLLALDVRPFAIAHRGFGENLGGDVARPIENTVAAVERGFEAGASVVEIDVQLTRDGRVAAFHDDFLADGTCLNSLTLAELQARLPHVPTLEDVLAVARRYNRPHPLRGLVIIELKAAAPRCDPRDTQEARIVAAVTAVTRHARMTQQVLLTSFSPALLYLAHRQAPEIQRIISVSGLQFLSAEDIEKALGKPVRLIDKRLDVGLQWAEVGVELRLPGYRSFEDLLRTAALVDVRAVEADLFVLHSAGGPLVSVLQSTGLKVFGFTANTLSDWQFLAALGLDGIYTNDVPLGVANEATIP
jgi:glycerophosphoryl diester phosphodiesterase